MSAIEPGGQTEPRLPVSPQLALRVAIIGGLAMTMFAIIFFRLWYLQVLTGDKYLKQAQNNQVRDVTVYAPRGEILDREGNVLVDNRTSLGLVRLRIKKASDELTKIFAGQYDAQTGANNIATAWEKLTDQIGRDKQIALYKASLGV